VRVEDIAYDKRPGKENVVYIVDSGRGRTAEQSLDTPNFKSTNGRVWKMVLDPDDPTVVRSLTVFVEGDDNPVKTPTEIHQPDNIETTRTGILVAEDPGSSQQYPVDSTDPAATTARLWRVPFAGTPEVVIRVDQSADGGPTDVDGRPPGNLGAWESSGIVDASAAFGPGASCSTCRRTRCGSRRRRATTTTATVSRTSRTSAKADSWRCCGYPERKRHGDCATPSEFAPRNFGERFS